MRKLRMLRMVNKTISLKQKHIDYVTSTSLNLSRYVQNKLDQEIKEGDKHGNKNIREKK